MSPTGETPWLPHLAVGRLLDAGGQRQRRGLERDAPWLVASTLVESELPLTYQSPDEYLASAEICPAAGEAALPGAGEPEIGRGAA